MEGTKPVEREISASWPDAVELSRADSRGRVFLRRYIGPKRAAAAAMLVCILAVSWYLKGAGILDFEALQLLVRDHPIAAPVVVILAYALCVASLLPTLPFNLAAGVFWGSVLGGLFSTFATTIGALVAFAAARSLFGRPLARHFGNRIVGKMQGEFERQGWWFVAFVRLNPAIPTGPLNYLFGLTGIDPFTYAWATFAFVLPSSIMVAFVGSSVGTFLIEGKISDALRLIFAVSAGVTALAVLAYSAHLLRRRNEKISR